MELCLSIGLSLAFIHAIKQLSSRTETQATIFFWTSFHIIRCNQRSWFSKPHFADGPVSPSLLSYLKRLKISIFNWKIGQCRWSAYEFRLRINALYCSSSNCVSRLGQVKIIPIFVKVFISKPIILLKRRVRGNSSPRIGIFFAQVLFLNTQSKVARKVASFIFMFL
jgi:hypothetical protein